jgi:lipopolysaccharide/colanic/teichoic acid biosynthesis glycosyltransferase
MSLVRVLDVIISFVLLLCLLPLFLIVAVVIKFGSKGTVFFKQVRVGKNNIDFKLYKFRTMFVDADKKGLLTVGSSDNRITGVGKFLRSYKLDELPQLLNVLKGEMSLVGPRPEVRKYVDLYTPDQLKILQVLPGITDNASVSYKNENELLTNQPDPENYYIHVIMPEKIRLNQLYINNPSLSNYFRIIFQTISGIFSKD